MQEETSSQRRKEKKAKSKIQVPPLTCAAIATRLTRHMQDATKLSVL